MSNSVHPVVCFAVAALGGMQVRVVEFLERKGIESVAYLASLTEQQLSRECSDKTIGKIREALADYGLDVGQFAGLEIDFSNSKSIRASLAKNGITLQPVVLDLNQGSDCELITQFIMMSDPNRQKPEDIAVVDAKSDAVEVEPNTVHEPWPSMH